MNKYILFLLTMLFAPLHLLVAQIDIEPVWVRVGDSYGAIDVENVTESLEAAVFSPDETLIASGAKKGWDIILWDAETGDKIWEDKAEEEIEVVDFTQDGKFVISGGEDKKLRVWDATTGEQKKVIENIAGFDAMDVSTTGNLLAGGDEAGQILLFDTETWEQLDLVQHGPDELTGAEKGVHSDVNQLDFSNDSKWLLSASRNGEVKLWEVTDDKKLQHVRTYTGHTATVKSVRLSPDEKFVAAGAGGANGVRIWNFETGDLIDHIPATAMIMETVEFTPDGKYLFTGGNEGEGKIGAPVENPGFENNDGMGHIRAYKVPEEGQTNFELVMEKRVFRQEFFDFTDDGRLLVTSHEDGTVRLWNLDTAHSFADTSIFVYDTIFIHAIGRSYERGENVTEYQDQANTGGNTSIRNYPVDELSWKTAGYYQRNRDLGQIFIPKKDTRVKSIVIRTGPTENAILWNVPGAEMFLQLFEIKGEPIINDNGTPKGTESTHGFTTNHRADDFIEGVAYQSLPTIYRGVFPLDAPVTKDEEGNVLSDDGRLHYLRWSFQEPILFEANKRYGFMIGFMDEGPGYRITIANTNKASSSDVPSLDDNNTPYKGGWSIRREGDGTLPPTQYPGGMPPEADTTIQQLKTESLFWEGKKRFTLSPTSDGFPDVDTYRAWEFYIEEDWVALEDIQLAESSIELEVGDEYNLIPIFVPENASDTVVSWSSTNSSVANIDSNGKIMAKSPGTAIVSVGVNFWEKHASTQVTVQDIQSSIAQADFNKTNLVTYPNPFSNQLTITLKDADANTLLILNQVGMVVKRLNIQAKTEGQFVWDGKDENGNVVPSGIYFVKSAGNELKMNSKIIKID